MWILLDGYDGGAGVDEDVGEGSGAGADLEDDVPFPDLRHARHLLVDDGVQHVMLTEGFPRRAAAPGVEGSERAVVVICVATLRAGGDCAERRGAQGWPEGRRRERREGEGEEDRKKRMSGKIGEERKGEEEEDLLLLFVDERI